MFSPNEQLQPDAEPQCGAARVRLGAAWL